jgi:glutathione S-transferase
MMEEVIHFYYHPWTRGGVVHWMLEELGQPYKVHLLDYNKGEQKGAKYLAINPMGKIPAIVHRGVVITEVAAICIYLADLFPEAKLSPSIDHLSRGTYLRWIFFAASCTEPAMIDKMFSRAEVNPKAIGYGTYEEAFKNLESALKPGPFILQDSFSAADVYIASQLSWGISVKAIEPIPVFEGYVHFCKQRPAYLRYMNQSKEMIKELENR